jgi:cytochrome c oxidase subunit 2
MCGEQHAQMRFSVVAVSAADFQKWATDQQQTPSAPTSEAATRGQKAVVEKCAACHTIGGTNAVGKVGPNLTHVASRTYIAGGILKRTDDNLKLWIQNPQAIKVGAKMPGLGLDSQTVDDVVAYLGTLK